MKAEVSVTVNHANAMPRFAENQRLRTMVCCKYEARNEVARYLTVHGNTISSLWRETLMQAGRLRVRSRQQVSE